MDHSSFKLQYKFGCEILQNTENILLRNLQFFVYICTTRGKAVQFSANFGCGEAFVQIIQINTKFLNRPIAYNFRIL